MATLGRLAIFALRGEVTGVIIVLFVGGKPRLQMETKQAAHYRFSSSQECKRLVPCAAYLARRRLLL